MKYLKILLFLLFVLCVDNVYASSIEYNITIEKNQMYKESIRYTISPNNKNGYLKSIFDDDVFFDKGHTIKYNKNVSMENSNTIVTLKHDGYVTDMNKSNFLNECFSEHEVSFDDYAISFYAVPEFKCLNHADNLIVKVTTDISSIVNNADNVLNNVYIWNQIDKNFYVNFEFGLINPSSSLNSPVKANYIIEKPAVAADIAFKDYSGAKIVLLICTVIAIIMVVIMIAKKANTSSVDNFYDN